MVREVSFKQSSSGTWLQQRTSARATRLLGGSPISTKYLDLFHGKAENAYMPPVVMNHHVASMALGHVYVILRLSLLILGQIKGSTDFCCKWHVQSKRLCWNQKPVAGRYRCFLVNMLLILHYYNKTQPAYLKKYIMPKVCFHKTDYKCNINPWPLK